MISRRRPFLSNDLKEALKEIKPYAKKGYTNAAAAIGLIESTVATASEELQTEINRLEYSNIRDREVSNTLREQLTKIQSDYTVLPSELREKTDRLSKADFTITVFGRTMAGKSTLMEILTRGDGSSIGIGEQRTTRTIRRYKYKNLQFVDVPGVAPFGEGRIDDEKEAFKAAEESDLIFFLMKDEDVQPAVADCLDRIISLGKPVICLINVQAGLGNADVNVAKTEITLKKVRMLRYDLEDKMSKEHLEGIKRQLFEYGSSYGNDNWGSIRFAYVHLLAAYLSQQKECADFSSELYKLSRFGYIDRVIVDEVTRNGGFYKLKAYIELVSTPLVGAVEMLFDQSAQNDKQGSLLYQKNKVLSNWISDFVKSAETRIQTFITTVSSDLKKEVALFAEANYNNKNAAQKWNAVVKEKNLQGRAEEVLQQLACECENEINEITRETVFDIQFSYKMNIERSLNMHTIVNGRRIWNWATTIVSGGLSIVGLFVSGPVAIIGVGVGFLGYLGNLIFKDYELKAKDARKKLEQKLIGNIDSTMQNLQKTMSDVLKKDLLEKHMLPLQTTMKEITTSLFALSSVQYQFAKKINRKLAEVNRLIVSEAIVYEGFEGLEYHIEEVARIPGYADILVLGDGKRIPDDARIALHRLLKEDILFVFKKDNIQSMLCQAIGKGCDREDISIQIVEGEPRIARIPTLDQVDARTRNRIRMAQQLTGLLIMK